MSEANDRPPFAPASSVALLLRVVLCDGGRAADAWRAWKRITIFDDIGIPEFRLMGEVAERLATLDPDYVNRARVAGMKKYVWSNNIHVIRPVLPVLDALNDAGIGFLVLKGGGVIAADPASLHRRYIRDIDLMVKTADIPAVADYLLADGWRPATGRIPGRLRAQHFDRPTRANPHGQEMAEIDLHRGALHFGRYGTFDDAFFGRGVAGDLLGRPVHYLCATDQALVATMHGLIWNEDPTFAWLVDAVRAFRDPHFDWALFIAEVERRRLQEHARRMLGFLEHEYGIGLPPDALARLTSRLHGALFGPEIAAIGRDRTARGLGGRAAILVAELLRSHALTASVPFRTDYAARLRAASLPPGPLTEEADFAYRASANAGTVEAWMRIDGTEKRMDFDIWQGERWIGRLKLRRRASTTGTHWRAMLPLDKAAGGSAPFRITRARRTGAD